MQERIQLRATRRPGAAIALAAALLVPAWAPAQSDFLNPMSATPPGGWKEPAAKGVKELEGVGITQRLDSRLDLDLEFVDSTGETVRLGDLFGDEPVVLSLVYYDCPMLCTLELNGLLKAMRAMEMTAGEDFQVVTLSFDPRETPDLAARKKQDYLDKYVQAGFYDRERIEEGWRFLVGEEENIRAVADAVGFSFRFDESKGLYRHASGIMTLTPDGRVSRYQMGVEYSARDLKFALIEASDYKIGNPVDAVMLYCFHYDPTTGKYGLVVMNALRLGGGLTLLVLGGFVGLSLLRDRRRRPAQSVG